MISHRHLTANDAAQAVQPFLCRHDLRLPRPLLPLARKAVGSLLLA